MIGESRGKFQPISKRPKAHYGELKDHLHSEMHPTINLTIDPRIDRTMHLCCIHTHPIDLTICSVVYKNSQWEDGMKRAFSNEYRHY